MVSEERTGTYRELRLESFRRVLAAHGVHDPELPGWMVEQWMSARKHAVRLHDDVEPELDQLVAAGRRLGAITNGNFPFVELDVARRFAFVVHARGGRRAEAGPGGVPACRRALGRRPGPVGARGRRPGHGRRRRPRRRDEGCLGINRARRPRREGFAPDAELPTLRPRRRGRPPGRNNRCQAHGYPRQRGRRACPSDNSARPSRTSETSTSASASASGSAPAAAIARSSRARRCRNEPSKPTALPQRGAGAPARRHRRRAANSAARRAGDAHLAPEVEDACPHSYARPGGGSEWLAERAPEHAPALVSGAATCAPKAKQAIAAAV